MKRFKHISLLLVAILTIITSCKDEDEKFDVDYAKAVPTVEKTTIQVGEEVEIQYSSSEIYNFSYDISEGNDYIEIVEKEGTSYIKGIAQGTASIVLKNDEGNNEVIITVGSVPTTEFNYVVEGDSILISNSGNEANFTYEITQGNEFIEIVEGKVDEESVFFIKGKTPGNADIKLSNDVGENEVSIEVVPEVVENDDNYVDNQGVIYSIDFENNTASVAGAQEGSEVGANYDVDFTPVDGIITIPVKIYYDGELFPIKTIDDYAFSDKVVKEGNSTLKELFFAEGSQLETIESYAFYLCSDLSTVDLSTCTSLTTILNNAFYQCGGLTTLNLSGCTSLTTIGEEAFYRAGLESIDFSGCAALTTIEKSAFTFSKDVKTLNFTGCASLTSIAYGAFYSLDNLKLVDLSPCTSLTSVDEKAFEDCYNTLTVTLPGSEWYNITDDVDNTEGTITLSNWDDAFSRTLN